MRERGHDVLFVADDERPAALARWVYERLSDAAVRCERWPGRRWIDWLASRPGRRTTPENLDGLEHCLSPVPQNAVALVMRSWKPDVVVGSSLVRIAWRGVRREATTHGIPTVLYLREDVALNHFAEGVLPADAIVANARSIADRVEALGFECAFVPSVIETSITAVESTRRVALAINPIESRGVELVWRIAAELPAISFVLQESWPLDPETLDSVLERVDAHPNVEFRRHEPPGPSLYRDARVLLVPYLVDNRPRVIAEAQANGIPVLVADVAALQEAIGGGGIALPLEATEAWCSAITLMWADDAAYHELAERARSHSARDEINPKLVAGGFESLLRRVLDQRG